jgi:hypothetical protein
MKRALCLGLLGCAALLCATALRADDKKDDGKGAIVDLGGMKSRAPAEWKEEEVTNRMRLQQFKLPKVKDDPQDAEVVIFNSGGTPEANIDRWKSFFVPPQGKTLDDVAKVTKMDVGDAKMTLLDISGTYKFKERPFDPNAKEELRPNSRMVGVVVETPKSQFQIRFVGPAATVENYKKGFDEWLKNFK